MAVSVVQTAIAANGGTGSDVFTFGAAPTPGNLLLFVLAWRDSHGPSTPAGVTAEGTYTYASDISQTVYYRVVESGDSATWTFAGPTDYSCAAAYELSGVDTTTPFDATPTWHSGDHKPATDGQWSVTPSSDAVGGLAITTLSPKFNTTATVSAPWTNVVDSDNNNDTYYPMYTAQAAVSDTSTLTTSWVQGATVAWVGTTIILRPGASTTPATVTAPAATATAAGVIPSIIAGALIAATAATAAASGHAPTVTAQTVVTGGGAATAAAVGLAPTVTGGAHITAPSATATAAGPAPTVTGSTVALITPPAATATAVGLAPTVTGVRSVTVTAPAGAASAAGLPPAVTGASASTVQAPAATATAVGLAPTVTAAVSITVSPPAGTAQAAGIPPGYTLGASISPPAGTATASGVAPVIRTGTLVTPAERVYSIPADPRTVAIPAEPRVHAVEAESRVLNVRLP